MEFFYRYMRRKTGWLMNGSEPEGGQWNYNEARLKSNPRMGMPYATLARMTTERRRQILQQAMEFLTRLDGQDT